jgi:protein disulfide-isomerase A1
MHTAAKLAFGLLASAALAAASDVAQLTKGEFDDFVKENDIVLAECKSSSRWSSAAIRY